MRTLSLPAQKYSLRKGHATMDEVTMSAYMQDTTAQAVMIYENYIVHTAYMTRRLQTREYSAKIKIFHPSQLHRAVVTIPYYSPEAGNGEKVEKIWAVSYNADKNGKRVSKSKLNPKEALMRTWATA